MAGMRFPLDIAWISAGRVIAVDTLQPCIETDQRQCPRWTSPAEVDALLEVPAGALNGVQRGSPLTLAEGAVL